MTYIDTSKPGNPNKKERTIFTSEEISKLWENKTDPIAIMALILIYTGMRVSELLTISEADVDLRAQTINITKSKTKAGIRKVPVANKIVELLPMWFETRHYGGPHTQTYYLNTLWPRGIRKLGMKHYSHDCRHTCATLLTELGISSEIRHAILGHSTGDVEEKIYTHIQLKTMLDAVNKLP